MQVEFINYRIKHLVFIKSSIPDSSKFKIRTVTFVQLHSEDYLCLQLHD